MSLADVLLSWALLVCVAVCAATYRTASHMHVSVVRMLSCCKMVAKLGGVLCMCEGLSSCLLAKPAVACAGNGPVQATCLAC